MATWRHGRIYLGGRWHEPSARALKLPARDNSAYLARWSAALAYEQVRGIKSGVTSLTVPSIGTVKAGRDTSLGRTHGLP